MGYIGERVPFEADDPGAGREDGFRKTPTAQENDAHTFFFIVSLPSSSSSSLLYYFVCAEQLEFTPTYRVVHGYARTRALHHVSALQK